MCILAAGAIADLGPPEVEFNFSLVFYSRVCIVRLGPHVVSIALKHIIAGRGSRHGLIP